MSTSLKKKNIQRSSSKEERPDDILGYSLPSPTLQHQKQQHQQHRAYDLTYGIDIIVTSPPTISRHHSRSNYDNNNINKIRDTSMNPKLLTPPSPINGVSISDCSHLQQDVQHNNTFLNGCRASETSSQDSFDNFIDRCGSEEESQEDSVDFRKIAVGMNRFQNAKTNGTRHQFVDKLNQNGEGNSFEGDNIHFFKKDPRIPGEIPEKVNIITPDDDIHLSSSSDIIPQENPDFHPQKFSQRFGDTTDRLSPHFPRKFHDRSYSGSMSAGSTGSEDDATFHRPPRRKNARQQWAYIQYHYIRKSDNNNNNVGITDYSYNHREKAESRKISILTQSSESGCDGRKTNIDKRRHKKYSTSSSHGGVSGLRLRTWSAQSGNSRTESIGSTCEPRKGEARIKTKKKRRGTIMKKLSTISVSSSLYAPSSNRNRGRTLSTLSGNSRASSYESDVSGRSNGSTMSASKWLRKTSMARIMGVTHAVSKFMKNVKDRGRRVSISKTFSLCTHV